MVRSRLGFCSLLILAALGVLFIGRTARRAESCSFGPNILIYSYSSHPDMPLDSFAVGRLGILKPSYARSYLAVAYRHLANVPLANAEVHSMLHLWQYRMGTERDNNEDRSERARARWAALFDAEIHADSQKLIGVPQDTEYLASNVAQAVVSARGLAYYVGSGKAIYDHLMDSLIPPALRETIRRVGRYRQWYSHRDIYSDAYRNAYDTYQSLVTQFGDRNIVAVDWLRTADTVFTDTVIPSIVLHGTHPLVRRNRAYLVASAYFYADSFDRAYSGFKRIERDTNSPWHAMAPYLAARAMIRKATLAKDLDTNALRVAENELARVIAEQPSAPVAQWSARMLRYVRVRLHPEIRLAELSEHIASPAGDSLGELVSDFTFLLDRIAGDGEDQPHTYDELPTRSSNDLLDWVLTFQIHDSGATHHAVNTWREKRNDLWLLNAISKVTGNHSAAPELVTAALATPAGSPAHQTAVFHAARILYEQSDLPRARAILDELLEDSARQSIPHSAKNDMLQLRTKCATSFADFTDHLVRRPIGMFEAYTLEMGDSTWDGTQLDTAEARMINLSMPLRRLLDLTRAQELPTGVQRDLSRAAWVRAILIGQDALAQEFASRLVEIDSGSPSRFSRYLRAETAEQRRFEALWILVQEESSTFSPFVANGEQMFEFDRAQEMDSHESYWCSAKHYHEEDSAYAQYQGSDPTTIAAPQAIFFTEDERAQAALEQEQLRRAPGGIEYLSREALAWAKAKPKEPRIPEALHLAVHASRYGCTDENVAGAVRAAFRYLHQKYPRTRWAAETPLWYSGR